MPLEIEAKLKVDDLDAVRRRLAQLSATPRGARLETNVFFDTDTRALLSADKGLRLRDNTDQRTGARQFVLTFKGPRQAGALKSREEIELVVGSFDDATALLERLGLGIVLSFEKRRESWSCNGCQVELDELPLLGAFVEIEGPDEPTILQTRRQLQLSDHPLVRPSYVALLLEHLRTQDQMMRDIRFERHEARPSWSGAGETGLPRNV